MYLLDVVGYSATQARDVFRYGCAYQIDELAHQYRDWCACKEFAHG